MLTQNQLFETMLAPTPTNTVTSTNLLKAIEECGEVAMMMDLLLKSECPYMVFGTSTITSQESTTLDKADMKDWESLGLLGESMSWAPKEVHRFCNELSTLMAYTKQGGYDSSWYGIVLVPKVSGWSTHFSRSLTSL